MLKRSWALIALVYLVLAEALSLIPVPDLALCLVQPEHGQQATNHDNPKYCPAFHAGAALVFERTDRFLEAHDKSVIGAFTMVLAISTIGLWLATNRLWSAGERQLEHLSETSATQLRAYISVELAGNAEFSRDSSNNFICVIPYKISNFGQTPAFDVQMDMNFIFGPQNLISDLPRPVKNAVRNSQYIAPTGSYSGTAVKAFSPDKLPTDPTQRLYILGVVSYEDILKARRETWVCSSLDQTAEFLAYRAADPHKVTTATFRGAGRQNYGT